HDHFGLDGVELTEKKRRAGGDFVGLGLTIAGRTALDHVADVHVAALEAHGFDHLREELSGASDKGQSLCVFIGSGTLTDENQLRFPTSVAEHDLVARAVQLAARAFAEVVANLGQRFGRGRAGGVEQRWAGRCRLNKRSAGTGGRGRGRRPRGGFWGSGTLRVLRWPALPAGRASARGKEGPGGAAREPD